MEAKELEFKRAVMLVDSGSGVDLRSKSVKLSAVLGCGVAGCVNKWEYLVLWMGDAQIVV